MQYVTDDTIVALSSAPGPAARCVIRLSGPQTAHLIAQVFLPAASAAPDKPTLPRRWTRLIDRIRLAGTISCPAHLYVFPAPHSYTGQDMAELHLPGSPALAELVLESLVQAGARPAQPGEFTARAFFHGRLDLAQAEAVAAVVSARTDAELRSARRLLNGALGDHCRSISDDLAEALAEIEADLDFSDQDLDPLHADALACRLAHPARQLDALLAAGISWSDLRRLPRVVLAGPINAGKSSLANALLGFDRSLVDALAGTTRDVLTAPLTLEHGECLLTDTAGLGPLADPLAHASQALARQAIAAADLILWVVDAADHRTRNQLTADLDQGRGLASPHQTLLVANKADLCGDLPARIREIETLAGKTVMPVSALYDNNLYPLRRRITEALNLPETHSAAEAIALTIRQRQGLEAARLHLQQAILLLGSAPPAAPPAHSTTQAESGGYELVSLELRSALDQLGTITGQVAPEAILARIFSRFCIGK